VPWVLIIYIANIVPQWENAEHLQINPYFDALKSVRKRTQVCEIAHPHTMAFGKVQKTEGKGIK
jgi:hypothetical protein